MKEAGQIVLTPFPYSDLSGAKLRPVLMLRQSPRFDARLVCMVSSRIDQADAGLDEVLHAEDPDFVASGLKAPSVLRLSRLALLNGSLLLGSIGAIADDRLVRVRLRIARWIVGADCSLRRPAASDKFRPSPAAHARRSSGWARRCVGARASDELLVMKDGE